MQCTSNETNAEESGGRRVEGKRRGQCIKKCETITRPAEGGLRMFTVFAYKLLM